MTDIESQLNIYISYIPKSDARKENRKTRGIIVFFLL
jgi:hypothetical protein